MFKFDKVDLPQLLLRKALLIVDFQQDFVGSNGAHQITLPRGYVERTTRLAKAFRAVGDVVWINSKFEEIRPPYEQQLEGAAEDPLHSPSSTPDPDAFLSHERAKCVLSSKIGRELPQEIKEEAEKKDVLLHKSHYSSFEGTTLLRLLRAKMTMEVYICGSLINAGVYATTIDAAGHGMKITLVDDCCGFSSEKKHDETLKSLITMTGCNTASWTEIVPEQAKRSKNPADTENASTSTSQADDIALPMSTLTLNTTAPRAAEGGTLQGMSQDALPKDGEVARRKQTNKADESLSQDDKDKSKYKLSNARDQLRQDGPNNSDSLQPAAMNTTTNDPSGQSSEQYAESLHNLCEGDTDVIENLLPPELESGVFDKLSNEVQWQRMSHQGGEVPRLVAVQGEVGADGSIPIYRHPSDESPPLRQFSPTVLQIKAETEKRLGHPLNHVLIQFYRDGKDYISEHSDKTLDIVRGSYIANVSLGAKRTMILRTKRLDKDLSKTEESSPNSARKTVRAPLPHNSLCRMGLQTNMKWLHSIKQDKRADREKSPEELAYGGGRISLTFRHIGTFLNKDETKIWGQGATGKTLDEAKEVINGQTEDSVQMLRAFGTENHYSNFDWDAYYGKGFDVLHLRSAPRFFASADPILNMRISIMLAEYEIGFASGSITQSKQTTGQTGGDSGEDVLIKYVDNDDDKTEVTGDLAIMLYLHTNHQKKKSIMNSGELAKQFTLFQKALGLLKKWYRISGGGNSDNVDLDALQSELAVWESYAEGATFLGGDRPNLADFALWPVLYAMVGKSGKRIFANLPALDAYYEAMKTRASTAKILERLEQV